VIFTVEACMSFDLAARLAARRAENLYRQRPLLESPQGPEVVVDGKPLLAFCNNDYLGLANHPQVIEAWRAGAERWGVGGGASHWSSATAARTMHSKKHLADLTGRPRALLFTTGYMANLGAVTALVGQGDTVLEDRLNHASLLDAGLLSGARFNRYLHNDAQQSGQASGESHRQHAGGHRRRVQHGRRPGRLAGTRPRSQGQRRVADGR
jgi:8-amino-7-oxononanoate synthase